MSGFPVGVRVARLNFGPAVSSGLGRPLVFRVSVRLPTLVWSADGSLLWSSDEHVFSRSGVSGFVDIPHPFQDGFVDGEGFSVRDFSVEVTTTIFDRGVQVGDPVVKDVMLVDSADDYQISNLIGLGGEVGERVYYPDLWDDLVVRAERAASDVAESAVSFGDVVEAKGVAVSARDTAISARDAALVAAGRAEAVPTTSDALMGSVLRDNPAGEFGTQLSATIDAGVDVRVPIALAADDTPAKAAAAAVATAVLAGGMTSISNVRQLGSALELTELDNILHNSTFVKGTDGWGGGNGTLSVALGEATIVGSGSTSSFGLRALPENIFTAETDDVLYMASTFCAVESGATALGLMIRSSAGEYRVNREIHSTPTAGIYTTLSGRYTVTSAWSGIDLDIRPTSFWGSGGNAAGKHAKVKMVLAVNLTQIFGSGNEPSLAQMDEWVQSLPDKVLSSLAFWPAPVITPRRPNYQAGVNGVVIRVDDVYETFCDIALPYINQRGLKVYLAACPGIPGTEFAAGKVASVAQLVRAHRAGNEVGNHTANHVTITDPSFLAKTDEASQIIVGNGMGYPTTFAYPTGARNAAMDREMYYRFDRALLAFEPNTTPVRFDQPVFHMGWRVVSGTATPERKLEQIEGMKRYVRGSLAKGQVPTLAFHAVLPPGQTPTVEWQLDWLTFKGIVDWLYEEGIPTVLPRDLKTHNMVIDPGFNEYPVVGFDASAYPWGIAAATGVWQKVTTGQHSGLGALRVNAATTVSGSASQGIAVEPGKTYKVYMLTKVASILAGDVRMRLRPRQMFGDSVGPDLHPIIHDTVTSGYQLLSGTFTAPSNTSVVSMFIRAEGFIGDAFVDFVAMFPDGLYDPLAASA